MSNNTLTVGMAYGTYRVYSEPFTVTCTSRFTGVPYQSRKVLVQCTECGTVREVAINSVKRQKGKCTCPGGRINKILSKATVAPSGCWEIPCQSGNYPSICVDYKDWPAHRLLYYLLTGDLPAVVRHTCDNRQCVNPWHLLPGTHHDNAIDKMARDRRESSRLKVADVKAIKRRLATGETPTEIYRDYGVCRTLIQHIKSGKRWSHVKI